MKNETCIRRRSERSIGEKFSRLTVLDVYWVGRIAYAKCRCDCGDEMETRVNDLRTGNTKSCGCHKREVIKTRCLTHGMTNSPEFKVWQGMRKRCFSTNERSFQDYGGRGIRVCDRWEIGENGKSGFQCFIEDMGPRPSKDHSIDRINNDGNYEPGNCRWATRKENNSNRRCNVMLTHEGKTQTQAAWARELGISQAALMLRVKSGKPASYIFSPKMVGPYKAPQSNATQIEFIGQIKNTTEWERELGFEPTVVRTRLKRGWTVEEALTTPVTPKLKASHV